MVINTSHKFILCLFLVFIIYIVSDYVHDKTKYIETLVNVDYTIKKPYNRGMGYPDVKLFAPFAYENMGNTIKYPDKIKDEEKRQNVYNTLYGEDEESFDKKQVIYEKNDKLYNDQKVYQDIMYFNSASNALRNFKHNDNQLFQM